MAMSWCVGGRSFCANEASALELQASEAGQSLLARQPPTAARETFGDPVAGVLEWLGRYDFRDSDVNSHTADRATRSGSPPPLPARSYEDETRVPAPAAISQTPRRLHQSPLEPRSPPSPPTVMAHSRVGGWCSTGERQGRDFMEEEEKEWDARQQKSGTVGRLVVYRRGDTPKEDIVLRGGGIHRIVVAGVQESGQAARVGVKAGDRLVSIDGRKDFFGLTADAVRDGLEAPTVLVFLGFVGKLQAEVRLTAANQICGISARQEVLRGSFESPLLLCEERIFNAGVASLFLSVTSSGEQEESARPDRPGFSMFELQRDEAHRLVRQALLRTDAQETSSQLSGSRPDSQIAIVDRGLTSLTDESEEASPLAPRSGQSSSPRAMRKEDVVSAFV